MLISARRVGPSGKAIGLDMTDEMLALARANAAQAGAENVEFVRGYIEEVPLPDGSVDVIVSNCVLNLSGDKPKVFAEAFRVLKPGGRFAVSDVIADPGIDDATRADMAQWTGVHCRRAHRGLPAMAFCYIASPARRAAWWRRSSTSAISSICSGRGAAQRAGGAQVDVPEPGGDGVHGHAGLEAVGGPVAAR